jgi:protein-S-isoprenylcysteine O-methyltransferase Ste14
MPERTDWLARSIMALTVLWGAGSLVLFVAWILGSGSLSVLHVRWSEPAILGWDALLSLAFFVQHSSMVRTRFRDRMASVIPLRYHAATYSIASGVILASVIVLWQPSGTRLLALDGLALWLARASCLLALAVFAWAVHALRSFDPFGLDPIKAHQRGRLERPLPFAVSGPYRWVRHPLYFCFLVLIWSGAVLTSDRLLFNVLWTAWICIGARLEEVDLSAQFGDAHREYRRKVPMLIPWRGPAAS